MTFRMSKVKIQTQKGLENSNSVQNCGAEDYIVNVEVEIENAAIKNSDKE